LTLCVPKTRPLTLCIPKTQTRYGTPEDCITGILENSEQLQAIIKKDWKKIFFGIFNIFNDIFGNFSL
jgi:hypothetical protein